MSHNDAYFVCAKHGNVYVMRDVTVYSVMDFTRLEPIHPDVEPVQENDKVECPLCKGSYRIVFRD